jgi:hypothetical protein
MALIPLQIPPGVFRNGTEFEQSNRWREANLIRWRDGSMRPIGGWIERKATVMPTAPRAMLAWVDNSADSRVALGSACDLYVMNALGTVTDITPVGLTCGIEDAAENSAYGGGFYGTGYYGVARPSTGVFQEATTWALDTWGEYLVACSNADGDLYEWQLGSTYGADVVADGDFASAAGWTTGADWTIASGVASYSGTGVNAIEQTLTVVDTEPYEITLTLIDPDNDSDPATIPSALVKIEGSSTLLSETIGPGVHVFRFYADGTSVDLSIEPSSIAEPDFDIDNVIVKQCPAAETIANAPTNCKSLVVTEERFLFALAADGNPRKVQWCDREDNTTWTPSATNEAGDFELQTTGQIMCGLRMRGRTLLLTDTDAHIATYSGPPFVYGFERVGTACGIASRKAAVAIDEGAFWMGQNGFYAFDGSVAREIACDVNDFVFDNINRDQISKAYAVHNSQFGEIWWFYPSGDSIENNRYVILDYKERHWSIGEIERTAGVDRGVFDTPIWSDSSANLYDHETGYVHAATVYAETGPISLGNGDQVMKVNNLIPDEKTQGQVEVTFKTRFHPNDTERSYGPYSTANPTSVRFTGRQVRMRVEATGNDNWRSGIMRIEAMPGGRR